MKQKQFLIILVIFIIIFLGNLIFSNDTSEKNIDKLFEDLSESQLQSIEIKRGDKVLKLNKKSYWRIDNKLQFAADANLINHFFTKLTTGIYLKKQIQLKYEHPLSETQVTLKMVNQKIKLQLHNYLIIDGKSVGRYLTYQNQLYLLNNTLIDIDPNERIWYRKFLPKAFQLKEFRLFKGLNIHWQVSFQKEGLVLTKPRKKLSQQVQQELLTLINKFHYLKPIHANFIERDEELKPYSFELVTHNLNSYIIQLLKKEGGWVTLKIKSLPEDNPLYQKWHFLVAEDEIQSLLNINKKF